MRKNLAAAIALTLLVGCAPARPTPASAPAPTPAPTPCAEPSANLDLSGSWMKGLEGAEPLIPEIVIQTECAHHPAKWVLKQRGDEIEAWTFEASMDQGIASVAPVPRIEPERGRVCGLHVTIENRYRLLYDRESGHLRGTLDGKPFWAVRQRVVGPEPCPGIP